MVDSTQRLVEVERLVNLVSGFGWSKSKEEIIGKKVIITVEKELLTASEAVGSGTPE